MWPSHGSGRSPVDPSSVRRRVRPLPLPTALSTGPLELRAGEFEHYSASDLDVKTLLALVQRDARVVRNVCIPSYFLLSDRTKTVVRFSTRREPSAISVRAGILVTGIRVGVRSIHLPPNLNRILANCERRGKRFVFFNTGLYFDPTSVGHANVLLFDLRTRTIERYEPAGRDGDAAGCAGRRECVTIGAMLKERLPQWRYVGPAEMPLGAQNMADSFEGMCVTFSLYYTLLRLRNPNETPTAVYRHIVQEHREGRLRTNILRLNKFARTILARLAPGALDSVRTRSPTALTRREGLPRSPSRRAIVSRGNP